MKILVDNNNLRLLKLENKNNLIINPLTRKEIFLKKINNYFFTDFEDVYVNGQLVSNGGGYVL